MNTRQTVRAVVQPPHRTDERAPAVHIHVLGPARIQTRQGQVTTGLRRISRDLLVLLALHPEGITREYGVEAIWPDRDLDGGTTMFQSAINNTHQVLRKATDLREPMFITYAASRYCLDTNLVDVDLWHLLRALHTAARADNDTDLIEALRHLADLYTGDLAEELSHEWAEAERERIRQSASHNSWKPTIPKKPWPR